MSRVGNAPVVIPEGVQVELSGLHIKVKGPKGELQQTFAGDVVIEKEDQKLLVKRNNELPATRALHGTVRRLIANLVQGVHTGFEKKLELVGVGYRAQPKGKSFSISLGYSHPIEFPELEGITYKVEETKITVMGSDKQKVGQVAAQIRKLRPPEPYKGKGVKYADEVIQRKVGKSASK